MKTSHVLFAGLVAAGALAGAAAVQAQAGLTKNPAEVRSGDYVLDPGHSKITWSVTHLGFSTYVGQFAGVSGDLHLDRANPAASRLQATIKTDSVGTLNAALDTHIKSPDFLDAAKFPTATFRSTAIKLVDADTVEIAGELTLKGVTKPVVLTADFNQAGVNPLDKKYSLGFAGRTKIKRSEFGVSYIVPAVSDDVTLELEAEFKLVEKPA